MKPNLNALPFLLFLTLASLHLTSCNKCEGTDTKVGETTITESTKSFLLQYVAKKVIFKDSSGHELVFNDTSGLVKKRDTFMTGISCQNNWPYRSLINFMEYESWSIGLKNENFSFSQIIYILNETQIDTTTLYDIFEMNILDKKSGLRLVFDMDANRGVSTRAALVNMQNYTISDTILNNKRFANLIKMPNVTNQVFLEGYFDRNKGLVVAFKLNDKTLWVLDRIE